MNNVLLGALSIAVVATVIFLFVWDQMSDGPQRALFWALRQIGGVMAGTYRVLRGRPYRRAASRPTPGD